MAEETWDLDELAVERPDIDEAILPHVLAIYNLAIEKRGRTREEVRRLVTEREQEAPEGQVVPLPVLYGTLLEDTIPIVVRDKSNPLGVRWFFGEQAEEVRRAITEDREGAGA